MATIIPLESLQPDELGRICDIDGDPALVHRLEEMGVRAGAQVRMLRSGEPCIVYVNHHRLSLRVGGQISILVEVAPQLEAAG